ncbi:MAG TPA: tail fiber protein [Steroidobacteraceae bacterium]
MSSPFIGEIRMFAGNFAPVGWAFCQGQLIPISENDVLFNLIGTTYGGDGQSTFALPNLSSRIPIHVGPGFVLGQSAGEESVTLTTNQIPSHSHPVRTATAAQGGGTGTPGGNIIADETGATVNPQPHTYTAYVSNANQRALAPNSIQTAGGSQPHDNMVPFVVVNFIISLFGVFPSQS